MATYGNIIARLQEDHKKVIRNRENIAKKFCNTELSITFNKVCIRENLLPIYTLNIPRDEAVYTQPSQHRTRPNDEQRREYMMKRTEELKSTLEELTPRLEEAENKWKALDIEVNLKNEVETAYRTIIETYRNAVVQRNQRKLVNLNGRSIKYPKPNNGYVNLTDKVLTPAQTDILNMGLNCHVMSKPSKHQKRIECEVLIDDVGQLAAKNKITVEPTFKQEIIAEASKTRGHYRSKILKKEHIEAAKELRADPDITIRKADKTSSYVIINTAEYQQKLDEILQDETKFKKINKDPTEGLKKKINSLIETNNALIDGMKLAKAIGEFRPGYCYGNIKTHKPGNKLRPIISQIPTPTYQLAKKLEKLLAPYVPSQYCLKSATDFLDILKNNNAQGTIASLDVESLFTNVPVDRTINYILDKVYRDENTPTMKIPENILRKLLECCTKEAPFTCPKGHLYQQVDGVAMGSPLGVLFANFFMGSVENETFAVIEKPNIYCRYIDDIFIKVNNEEEMEILRSRLQDISGLQFTIERSNNGTMPFLDVLVKQQDSHFNTSVYVKDSNTGHCLNGDSECPQRYKDSTISAYIRRALTHCSTWTQVNEEIERVSQVLVNNGFANDNIQSVTRKIINKWYENSNETQQQQPETIKLYYRAIFSSAYKEDERILKQIVKRNIKPTDAENKVNLIIYYKSKTTRSLLMRNSPQQETDALQRSHVVYRYTCKRENCTSLPSTYIGMTTTKLGNRLNSHKYAGAPKNHMEAEHHTKITKEELEHNTEILASCNDVRRLPILEALYIKELSPNINIQAIDLQALPSMKRTLSNRN